MMCLLKQTKILDKTPLMFNSRSLNNEKMIEIKNNLSKVDWYGLLNKDKCNDNFNTFSDTINEIMDITAPVKTVRISAWRKYVEPWMSQGIEKYSRKKLELYKETLKPGVTEELIQKYKNYRKKYNHLKRASMTAYYRTKVNESKTNTKKLWKVINNIIGKTKNNGSIILYITVDGVKKYDPSEIANEFRQLYFSLGSNLAKDIKPGQRTIEDYMSRIPRTLSLALHATSPTEIEKIIKVLPSKTTYGHEKISNNMLKTFNEAISHPLSLLFIQSIAEGSFPKRMKQAEVVFLYKGKDVDTVVNYRPISLLITISKVLEKVIYRRVYSFLETNDVLYQSQYGFHLKHNCEQAIFEFTDKILQAKEKGEHQVSIFLDLSKVFNTLNHKVLLDKLERVGISGLANNWFESYRGQKPSCQSDYVRKQNSLLRGLQHHLWNCTGQLLRPTPVFTVW